MTDITIVAIHVYVYVYPSRYEYVSIYNMCLSLVSIVYFMPVGTTREGILYLCMSVVLSYLAGATQQRLFPRVPSQPSCCRAHPHQMDIRMTTTSEADA